VNIFIVPVGIWLGTPNLSVDLCTWKGMVPACLANTIGGGLSAGRALVRDEEMIGGSSSNTPSGKH